MHTAGILIYHRHAAVTTWVIVNLVDTALTLIALNMGATEMGLCYRMTGSLYVSTAMKYLSVFLIVDILVQMERTRWLNWLIGGMLFVVAWNLAQIIVNL